jgi:glucokinase
MSRLIVEFALTNSKDKMLVATMETFVKIYASKVGDVAFSLFPHGGIYIIGNISQNILVTNTEVGLNGAENCAFKVKHGIATRQ